VAYFTIASVLLVLAAHRLGGTRTLGYVVALAAALETAYVAWSMFYAAEWMRPFADGRDSGEYMISRYVEDDAHHGLAQVLRELRADDGPRVVGISSIFDNAAWYVDGRALLGYSAKPLIPWYAKLVRRISTGVNERDLTGIPQPLLQNMNVRYVIHRKYDEPLRELGPALRETKYFSVHQQPDPLPYVYTQDRVSHAHANDQLAALLHNDLREVVYVDSAEPAGSQGERPADSDPASGADWFAKLQRANKVLRVDQSRANRTVIHADIQRPAMLVIVECWHPGWTATIDGRPAKVERVNFLQQGVWLSPGQHVVQLRFFPRSVWYGTIACVTCVGILVVVLTVVMWPGRPGKVQSESWNNRTQLSG
jgi:hypothetical protein